MRKQPTWEVEIFRRFISEDANGKPILDENGEPTTIVVVVRHLYLEGDFVLTNKYWINRYNRSYKVKGYPQSETRYSVKKWQEPPKPRWLTLEASAGHVPTQEGKWVAVETLDYTGIQDFLRRHLPKDWENALEQLDTHKPDKGTRETSTHQPKYKSTVTAESVLKLLPEKDREKVRKQLRESGIK